MTTRRPLIAGNWKMNGSSAFVDEFSDQMVRRELPDDVDVVLFPPIAYLGAMVHALQRCAIQLGAQNAHTGVAGAFTGETAPEMIRDLGAQWLLVGHSERREYWAETNDLVAEKFAAAVRADLKPILCIGETLAERQAGRAQAVVREQVRAVADQVGAEILAKGTLAYEPVWAIGTGQTASPDEAQSMHLVIRKELAGIDANIGDQTRVLYGGSMNTENAVTLLRERDIDGGLIGGASLQADGFGAIVEAARAASAHKRAAG